ncbi:MAG: family 1 glycosylhydrolase [Chloroflexi bacterium]|nr:family 1 glycosylhydrolase [Chloroflexota bacterium]
MFATGIENSYPMIALPDGSTKRMDEMEKTDHYRRWREDFGLVNELGIEYLRYGPPYYKTHVGPDRFDWGFADETFHELKRLGITPVADLCHFGVPDWLGNFQNPDFAAYFPEYARAFAERYPWVHYFTPINEMYVTALFSAQLGWWNERLAGDRPFVTALKHIAKANVLAMEAILQVRGGDVMFVQSESAEYFHAAEPAAEDLADHLNEKRFLSLDLNYGFNLCATMVKFLMANGMTWDEFCFFLEQKTKRYCIMGNDYYVTNEHMVYPDGRVQPSGEVFGYYVITKQYFDRYKLPVMHTETNIAEDYAYPRSAPKPQVTPESGSVHWLKKEWANMLRLKRDGVPIIGFTWYSLIDQVDWDTALREDNGHVNPLGLYDIDRKIRPVGEAYRHLIAQWRDILPTQSICLQVA